MRHELLRRRRVDADGRVELRLGGAGLTAMAMPWMISPASGPTMCAPTTRSLARSTTSFMKVRSCCSVMVACSGRNRSVDVDCAVALARAAPRTGRRWRRWAWRRRRSARCRGRLRRGSRRTAWSRATWPRRAATGVSLMRSSHIADRVDRRHGAAECSSTTTAPSGGELHAGRLEAEPARVRRAARWRTARDRLAQRCRRARSTRRRRRARARARRLAAELQIHAVLRASPRASDVGDLGVEAAQQPLAAVGERRLDAEAVEDGGELAARCSRRPTTIARAAGLEVERVVRGDRELVPGNRARRPASRWRPGYAGLRCYRSAVRPRPCADRRAARGRDELHAGARRAGRS